MIKLEQKKRKLIISKNSDFITIEEKKSSPTNQKIDNYLIFYWSFVDMERHTSKKKKGIMMSKQ